MTLEQRDVFDERGLVDRVEAKLVRLGASFERAELSIMVDAATESGFEAGLPFWRAKRHSFKQNHLASEATEEASATAQYCSLPALALPVACRL